MGKLSSSDISKLTFPVPGVGSWDSETSSQAFAYGNFDFSVEEKEQTPLEEAQASLEEAQAFKKAIQDTKGHARKISELEQRTNRLERRTAGLEELQKTVEELKALLGGPASLPRDEYVEWVSSSDADKFAGQSVGFVYGHGPIEAAPTVRELKEKLLRHPLGSKAVIVTVPSDNA